MKIIIVDQKHGETRSLVLKGWARVALSVCLLGIPVILGYYGYHFSALRNADFYKDEASQAWMEDLKSQRADVDQIRQDTLAQLEALTLRMANLQARILRLDALGQRLTEITELDDGEFDFTQTPAIGGPETADQEELKVPDFIQALDNLTREIEDKQQQLELLDSLMADQQIQTASFLSGRPVDRGWISSPFGRRIDPFTGNLAWHQGIDFATGRTGVDVKAVASGVVTFAEEKQGYGMMVKVNHGNGYETLYAHDEKLLVKPGDIIKKGQIIALSGNSGRSTGPHVHFEVHKNGRVVDPSSYVHRTSR
ncbi:MAG: peptidoglycan DD-metalloendopeptidase family protein [Gammaproteobacteria bacterium]|nr:peptidoglycan DD-metalloendopeptidase family protein [Gammaproteobacteria bacterium]